VESTEENPRRACWHASGGELAPVQGHQAPEKPPLANSAAALSKGDAAAGELRLGKVCCVPTARITFALPSHGPVARVSAAAFAVSNSFATLISFLSGAAWDMAGKVDTALIPILLGTLPISILAPTLAPRRT